MLIDLRSDTVTRPTAAMRKAMHDAEVGDDVFGEDPTVARLEAMAAERLDHAAGLFFPTGTQSNLVALLSHCERGDEYVCGHDAHTYKYEGGGAAVLGSVQPQPIPFDEQGGLSLEQIADVIKADDVHFARTRLVCLENTQHGRVQSVEYMQAAQQFAHGHGLKIHLDGARAANAAVVLNVSLDVIGHCFDSVSLCLSKGLGAPLGSVLVGDTDFISRARRWRKVTGGGMRQAGVVAAAGLLALEQGIEPLHEDHRRAAELARALAELSWVELREGWVQSNMVWLRVPDTTVHALKDHAASQGVLLNLRSGWSRLVLHRDVPDTGVQRVLDVFSSFESQTSTN